MGTEAPSKKVCRSDSRMEGNFRLLWEVRDEGMSLSLQEALTHLEDEETEAQEGAPACPGV